MYRPFKAPESVDPWDLIFHKVSVLDTAGALAEKTNDFEGLLEVANKIGECSDDLIQVYLLLTQEQEEEEGEHSEPRPLGFIHQPKPDED